MNLKSISFCFLFLTLNVVAIAQSPIGVWKTVDDETGDARSHVEIYEENGKIYGKVVKLLDTDVTVCDDCSGKRKGAKLIGMQIMWDMIKSGDVWKGGKIFSPTKDTEYKCKLWFDDKSGKELQVRGYYFGFFRTQTWYKLN